ncbi:LuxR C-terminal-related transcriptional regulator [Actinocorallia sp. API 0066]|uniref:LuxR C-terminal-related transcriptional regulator n=1 Tax=Actinocorallia sp. API 0066 TaxID=2896846 RepID=UPI001E5994CA|nr:LuxR family transcriptional regulator [Actinocorallia sp. API 0066]MCD0448599.1 LuxR C-terminal-related transcriptional regulator [Actinocorallia sp. API 0066]
MGVHGRDRELDLLDRLVVSARAGRGGALAVRSGPGLGRSTLLRWAARRASPDFRVLSVPGVRVEAELAGAALGRFLPGGSDAPQDVHRRLAELAADRPLLCVADDAHWMDAPSLNALAFTARRAESYPILMLFGASDGRLRGAGRDRLAAIPDLALPPLDDTAARLVLREGVEGIPTELESVLVELAGGNPRALRELGRALTPGQLSGIDPPPVTLPPGSELRAVYRRRFMRLPEASRLLLLFAVVEESLDIVTLGRAAAAAGVDLAALEPARDVGLLTVEGDHVSVPGQLVRGVLQADAPLADLNTAHRLLARVMDRPGQRARRIMHRTSIAPRPGDVEELRAVAAGADPVEAAAIWARAADLSGDPADLLGAASAHWRGGASARARVLVRRALADPAVPPGEAELLLGEIELFDGMPEKARTLYAAAADLLPEPERLDALARAGEAAYLAGDIASYLDLAERAKRTPGSELLTLHFQGTAAAFVGEDFGVPLRRLLGLPESCMDHLWASTAASLLGDDLAAHELATGAVRAAHGGNISLRPCALHLLAQAELWRGRFCEAAEASREGLALAEAVGQGNVAVDHRALLALVAALRGDRNESRRQAGIAATTAAARGLSRPEAFISWAEAALDLLSDRPAEAAARLRIMTVHPVVRVMSTPLYVEAEVHSGGREAAARSLAVFDMWAQATANPARLALSRRCHALLAAGGAAEEHFSAALALHRLGGSPFELARTELLFGSWLRRSRRPSDARPHLRYALHLFRHYEAEAWAGRARAELRAAGESALGGEPAAELTAQQEQIARLAAEGATNREIAARLVLSPRTVEHHLRNVFTRLGVRSRVELTKFF